MNDKNNLAISGFSGMWNRGFSLVENPQIRIIDADCLDLQTSKLSRSEIMDMDSPFRRCDEE
jgi:hypothetical protein